MAFCTTLRRRPSFAPVVSKLIAGEYLREHQLDSHDISIPLVASNGTQRRLRVLLLSPHAVEEANRQSTIDRVERFIALTGGTDSRIVLLLNLSGSPVSNQQGSDAAVYSRLQVMLLERISPPHVQVLPLAALDQLPALLQKHVAVLSASHKCRRPPSEASPFELLRQCTMSPPMDETMAHLITDTFANIKELALACSTEGHTVLGAAASDDSDRTMDSDDVSPYFSSSGPVVGSSADSHLVRKLRKLQAFNVGATRDLITFWQAEWLLD